MKGNRRNRVRSLSRLLNESNVATPRDASGQLFQPFLSFPRDISVPVEQLSLRFTDHLELQATIDCDRDDDRSCDRVTLSVTLETGLGEFVFFVQWTI